VIDDAARQAVLAMTAPDERIAVFAAQPDAYRPLLAARAGVTIVALDAAPAGAAGYTTAVIEGLDAVDDPRERLSAVAAAVPGARVIALVANGAFALAIDALVAGEAWPGHALTEGELAPLFDAAGLDTLSVTPVLGGTVRLPELPIDVATGHMKIRIDTTAVLARLQIAAYVVVARAR
jgi:hypothetical protein